MDWKDKVRELRLWPWVLACIVFLVAVGVIAPQQLGVLAWIMGKLTLGAALGYWLHRGIERGQRPHELTGAARDAALSRRVAIVAAMILSMGFNP